MRALEKAQSIFDRISIDLIYATPNQSVDEWQNILRRALNLGLSHISLYQLTIEKGTFFYTRAKRGEIMTVDDDRAATLYEITNEITEEADLLAYEISNHAIPGEECRHNLNYWRGGDWLGIGPGAYGRFTQLSTKRVLSRNNISTRRKPESWLKSVQKIGHGIEIHQKESVLDWPRIGYDGIETEELLTFRNRKNAVK